jgi:hypothetical protein
MMSLSGSREVTVAIRLECEMYTTSSRRYAHRPADRVKSSCRPAVFTFQISSVRFSRRVIVCQSWSTDGIAAFGERPKIDFADPALTGPQTGRSPDVACSDFEKRGLPNHKARNAAATANAARIRDATANPLSALDTCPVVV